jgi:hypothetical protein
MGRLRCAQAAAQAARSAAVQWRESVALCARLRACGRKAAATARRDTALVALPLGLCGSRAVLTPPSKQEEELFSNRFAACVCPRVATRGSVLQHAKPPLRRVHPCHPSSCLPCATWYRTCRPPCAMLSPVAVHAMRGSAGRPSVLSESAGRKRRRVP